MKRTALQHFPLTSAYLCQDCSSVGNSANHCPACASSVLLSLSGVLNREEKAASQVSRIREWTEAVAA